MRNISWSPGLLVFFKRHGVGASQVDQLRLFSRIRRAVFFGVRMVEGIRRTVPKAGRQSEFRGWAICMTGKNPAYRAAMKKFTSMPTSHPYWIDDRDYFRGFRKFFHTGISFQKAFLIVICLHFAGIAALYGFSNLRGMLRARPLLDKSLEIASQSSKREDWPNHGERQMVAIWPEPQTPQRSERIVETKGKSDLPNEVKKAPVAAANTGKVENQSLLESAAYTIS